MLEGFGVLGRHWASSALRASPAFRGRDKGKVSVMIE